VIDDHSRYVVALFQTGSTRAEAVREQLVQAFNGCGVPEAMLMDHGIPWWSGTSAGGWTQLTVWLMKQGVRLYLSGVRHPQTQGKVERFHGALEKARRLRGLPEPALRQRWLDDFRQDYNHVRPHEALAMRTRKPLVPPVRNPTIRTRRRGTIRMEPRYTGRKRQDSLSSKDDAGKSQDRSPQSKYASYG
jgi:transposase InsO family protein